MIVYRMEIFVVAVLYSLPEKRRGIQHSTSFEEMVAGIDGVNLHYAFNQLKKEKLLGEFSSQLNFDPLYSTSTILNDILAEAARDGLIRTDGVEFFHHLDILRPYMVEDILLRNELSSEWVKQVALRLGEILNEQEQRAKQKTPA